MLTDAGVRGRVVVLGNVGVYPGGHVRVQGAFHAAAGVQRFLNEHKGLPELRQLTGPLADPTQLIMQPGDVLLSHYSLPMVAVPNVSPHVRVMVSFRVYHASHVPGVYRPDAMDNIWLEYDGLRDVVAPQLRFLPPVGADLVAATVLASLPTTGARPSGVVRPCPRCRTAQPVESRFCAQCGSSL
jgi:hypothetical protein